MFASAQMVEPGKDVAVAHEQQYNFQSRVMSALAGGLPALPRHLFQLNTLLASRAVNLENISPIIRSDPAITAELLRTCNTADLLAISQQVQTINELMLPTARERLQMLVLTCFASDFVGRPQAVEELTSYWQHSYTSALLSEKIARLIGYSSPERAYTAGLLHDVGILPLMLLSWRDTSMLSVPEPWIGSPETERQRCGLDHCDAGRLIGINWNFGPELVDVLEYHHRPAHNSPLVGIVAAADQVSRLHGFGPDGTIPQCSSIVRHSGEILASCLPQLTRVHRDAIVPVLENELMHITELPEFSNGVAGPELVRWSDHR